MIITDPNLRFCGLYRRFQIGCVFVEYDLFNTTTFIQKFIYMQFGFKVVGFNRSYSANTKPI